GGRYRSRHGGLKNSRNPAGDLKGPPPGFVIALFQHVPEIQRDGAVLQDKGGDADAAVF
ncbi:Cysteine-rich KTR, partial [Dysosmobacter welbionis]